VSIYFENIIYEYEKTQKGVTPFVCGNFDFLALYNTHCIFFSMISYTESVG